MSCGNMWLFFPEKTGNSFIHFSTDSSNEYSEFINLLKNNPHSIVDHESSQQYLLDTGSM